MCLNRLAELRANLILVGVMATVAAAPVGVCAQDQQHVAVLFRDQASHRSAAMVLESAMLTSGHRCTLIELPKTLGASDHEEAVQRLVSARPDVVASAGTQATLLALKTLPDTPVVFMLVPHALDSEFVVGSQPHAHRAGGVTTDIAPDDQLDWILAILPGTRSIAVPRSERSARTVAAIQAAGRRRGIAVRAIPATHNTFPDVINRLNADKYDGVLMIPDANVYSSLTVQRLLLWGLRQKKPVWAFSDNVVRAGALGGTYSDGEAVGRQVARIVQEVIDGADIGQIGLQYSEHKRHAVNDRTAQMIGVSIPRHALTAETERFENGS